jgi:hypothetical protein
MNYRKALVTLSFALAFSPGPSPAVTVITSLPHTINAPGVFVLKQSLSYSSGTGNAISVAASNVTIDLSGYTITNTADQSTTTANCIYGNNEGNLTVENGQIFGFEYGVYMNGPTSASLNAGHVVQAVHFNNCTGVGVFFQYGDNCLVQNCQFFSIGTTTGGVLVNSSAAGVDIYSLTGGSRIYRCQALNTPLGFSAGTNGTQGSYLEQNLATHCTWSFHFNDAYEAYRDNASFGATTAAFYLGNDFGGNHSQ